MIDRKLTRAAKSLGLVHKKRRKKSIGLPPGTLIHTGVHDHLPVYLKAFEFSKDYFKEYLNVTIDQLKELKKSEHTVWIKVVGVHDANLIKSLGDLYEIQALVLEDIMNTHQRTKIESYPGYTFIVQNVPYRDEQDDLLTTEQVSFLAFNSSLLISFQERDTHVFQPIVNRISDATPRLRTLGVPYLTYALFDILVDGFFPILDSLYDKLESVEEEIIKDPQNGTLTSIHRLRQNLILCRKCVWPSRDMLSFVMKENPQLVNESVSMYYRDVYDHTIQLIDTIESYRDVALSLVDSYMNQISLKMNEVIKILTIISTIFIPLSFIASLYGMNFSTTTSPLNMPELNWYFGYPFALLLMGFVAGSLLLFFRRKRWI